MTDIGRAREAVAEATRTTPRTGVRAASHGRAIGPRLPGPADAPSTCMRDDRPPRRHNTPPLLCMRDDRPPPHPALCALVHARRRQSSDAPLARAQALLHLRRLGATFSAPGAPLPSAWLSLTQTAHSDGAGAAWPIEPIEPSALASTVAAGTDCVAYVG